jgi:hypothetical protein
LLPKAKPVVGRQVVQKNRRIRRGLPNTTEEPKKQVHPTEPTAETDRLWGSELFKQVGSGGDGAAPGGGFEGKSLQPPLRVGRLNS